MSTDERGGLIFRRIIMVIGIVESLLMATHLGPHSIEIALISPLIYGHPSIMAEIFGPNGGHYRGVSLYLFIQHFLNPVPHS